jgi:hypothetical protein
MSRKFPQALIAIILALFLVNIFLSGLALGSTSSTSSWPGQSGNPVGYAAYGPLGTTPWPGGGFKSGTADNPTIYTGYVFNGPVTVSGSYIEFISCDFNSGSGGVMASGSNITFIGSRFQSNQVEFYNVQVTGTNVTFFYDSFTPLTSFYTSPPGSVWPSAGQNTLTMNNGNSVSGNDGYQFGVNVQGGNSVSIYYSDFWGFGNAIAYNTATSSPMLVVGNWIHDAANISPQGYHTDGPGYLNGGAGPSNITVLGNTIASLGNSNGIAFQAATSGYSGMQIQHNYLSGFGYTTAPGNPGSTHFSNSTVTFNTFGTDVEPYFGPLYANNFPSAGNSVWACNQLAFRPGTNWTDGDGWTPTSSIDGKYWVPSSTIASGSDWNGNTICASVTPSSLAWKSQGVKTSSSQVVTLANTNTGTITNLSVSLKTGTQFSISSNTCGSSLSPGAICTVTVTFNPTSQGPQADNLQFTSNALAPSSPQFVPLIGVGTGSGAQTGPNPPTSLNAIVQ